MIFLGKKAGTVSILWELQCQPQFYVICLGYPRVEAGTETGRTPRATPDGGQPSFYVILIISLEFIRGVRGLPSLIQFLFNFY